MSWSELMYLLDEELQEIDQVIEEFWKDMNMIQHEYDTPKVPLIKEQSVYHTNHNFSHQKKFESCTMYPLTH